MTSYPDNALEDGWQAYHDGFTFLDRPFRLGSPESNDWQRGWLLASKGKQLPAPQRGVKIMADKKLGPWCPFSRIGGKPIVCGPECALYSPTALSPDYVKDALTFTINKCAIMVLAENAYFDLLTKTKDMDLKFQQNYSLKIKD